MSIALVAEEAEREIWRSCHRPPPKMSVVEWADAFRYLPPESAAEPGKYSSHRAPYQREPMRVMSDPTVRRVVLDWGSQLGKSLCLENVLGACIHLRPRPVLVVQPTIEFAEQFSKERFAPMVRETPVLRDLVKAARSRDSDNTLRLKMFPGGFVAIVGSNAPSGLASRPIALVLCDEIDRYEESAGTEGDAIELAERRLGTFHDGKIILTSTPGVKGESRIEPAYLAGDQRKYYVPCPHCQEMQTLAWGGPSIGYGLKWETGKPRTAAYCCAHCATLIEGSFKSWMLAHGEWRSENAEGAYPSFHLNGLYSPFGGSTWAHHVEKFLEVKHVPSRFQTFVNTVLAETWEEPGERIESHTLLARLEDYAAPVPAKAALLTAGVDVQGDRLEIRVWAWGAGEESWLVRGDIIPGDPGTPHPWRELDRIRREPLQHESGAMLGISCTFIDSGGHHAPQVYAYARERANERVYACKGIQGDGVHICGKPTHPGAARTTLYPVGTFAAKERFLRTQIRIPVGEPGSVHLPDWCDVEELEQLTAEKLVPRVIKGRVTREWKTIRERNEALDCRIYAMAALFRLGPATIGQLGAMAAKLEANAVEKASLAALPPANTVPFRPAKPSNWVNRWR